jgi:hypothetical protein
MEPPKDWDHEKHGHCATLFVRASHYNGIALYEVAWELTEGDIEAAKRGERLIVRLAGPVPPLQLFFEAPPPVDPVERDGN